MVERSVWSCFLPSRAEARSLVTRSSLATSINPSKHSKTSDSDGHSIKEVPLIKNPIADGDHGSSSHPDNPALASLPSLRSSLKDSCWVTKLVEALPMSVAILSSDAMQVLYHKHGSEPAAAQLLDQALQSVNACTMGDGLPHCESGTKGRCTSSLLAAVLGPEAEATALAEVHKARFWKGTISSYVSAREQVSNLAPSTYAGVQQHYSRTKPEQGHILSKAEECTFRKHDSAKEEDSGEALFLNASEPSHQALTSEVPITPKSASLNKAKARRQSSFLMSDSEIKAFETTVGSDSGSKRTRALLRSLSQRRIRASQDEAPASPSSQVKSDALMHSSTGTAMGSVRKNSNDALAPPFFDSSCSCGSEQHHCRLGNSSRCTPVQSESAPHQEMHTQKKSFEAVVCLLEPGEGERSPLVIAILDITQHAQARDALFDLAESQLALLSSMMPLHAVQFLALESTVAIPQHVGQLARAHTGVTLLFMDICGFTEMCKNVEAAEVMVFLNAFFSALDQLTDMFSVHKVETAGDCYIVSGGIMSPEQSSKGFGLAIQKHQDPVESAKRVMDFAKGLLEEAKQVTMPDTKQPVRVRVGMHTGDVVSGLIGSKLPKFSLFGDTMNTASRMESTGVPGRIHVSETTHALLQHETWEPTGGVEVKGKGLMQTYLWDPQPTQSPSQLLMTPASLRSTDSLPSILLKKTQQLLHQLTMPSPAAFPMTSMVPQGAVLGASGVARGSELGAAHP